MKVVKTDKLVIAPDKHLSLGGLIKLYEDMMKSGRIKADSAASVRLTQLRKRAQKRRKWLNTPYAKRKFMQAPQQV